MLSRIEPNINPWKGLHFYTEDDHNVFFGREQEALDLLHFLKRDCLTILFARSGMGKTSLLRAGVIPKLRNDNCLPVIVRIIPEDKAEIPSQQIISALQQAAYEHEVEIEPLVEGSGSLPETLWEYFHRHRFWGKRNDPIKPILILDQFEELFTLGHDSPTTLSFLEELADLVENRMPLSLQKYLQDHGQKLLFEPRFHVYNILLSLREDFVPFLDRLQPSMPAIMRNRYCLGPLLWSSAVEIVKRSGRPYVSGDVAETIVTAVTTAKISPEGTVSNGSSSISEVDPAYLSVMCHELFRRMVEKKLEVIDVKLVNEESGSILCNFYARSFVGLLPSTRPFVEDHLLSESGYRLTVPIEEADKDGVSRSDLEKLVNLRLLRFEYRLGTTHVELAHDLLREIVLDSRLKREQQIEEKIHKQEEEAIKLKLHRSRRSAKIGLLTSCTLFSAIILYLCGTQFDSYTYTATIADEWGEPTPTGKLPFLAQHSRNATFRITRKGWWGNVKRLDIVNAQNQPTDEFSFDALTGSNISNTKERVPKPESNEKVSMIEYSYDNNNNMVYKIARSKSNHIINGLAFTPIKGDQKKVQAIFLGPGGHPRPYKQTGAEFIEITRNSDGLDVTHMYKDTINRPTLGPNSVFGKKMTYKNKRLVKVQYLDASGSAMTDADGKAGEDYDYDRYGNQVGVRAFNDSGKPTYTNSGYYKKKITYDAFRREKEIQFLGFTDEEPAREEGTYNAHIVKIDLYDKYGNPLLISFLDEFAQPRKAPPGSFASYKPYQIQFVYNIQNKPIRILYKVNAPDAQDPKKWNEIYYRYDPKTGRIASQSLFSNIAGTRTRIDDSSWGAHMILNTYDQRGNIIEERYLGSKLEPANLRVGGYHLAKIKHDEFGNPIQYSFFDIHGNKAADKYTGAHLIARSYDRHNNLTSAEYFDVNSHKTVNQQGFHKVAYRYDELGNLVELRWFDQSLQAVKGPDGVNLVRHGYFNKNKISIKHYNEDATAILSSNFSGISEERLQYNERHQLTDKRFFGLNASPVEDSLGIHHYVTIFNRHGQEIERLFFDRNGKPAIGSEGYHRSHKQQSPRPSAYYDLRNKLMIGFDPDNPDPRRYVLLPYIARIPYQGALAFVCGLREGDIFLSYGNWTYEKSIRTKGIASNLRGDLMAEIRRQSQFKTRVVVLRDGRLLTFSVPPLPMKLLGVEIQQRTIPKDEIKYVTYSN